MSKLSEKRSTHATLFPIIAFLPILLISLIPTGDHLPIVAGIIVLLGMLFLPFLNVKTE